MSDPGLERLRVRLADRYAFEAMLGRGAFASVFLVRNLKLKRREALKILADSRHGDSDFALRFVAEATTVASLDHPNIVQVYDYGEVEGVLWYSMQYIEGPTLWAERQARRRLDRLTALRIFLPLLEALEFSHQRGVIHRDVKPANIILNQQGRPFLMDFGIAKSLNSGLLTVADKILGTPAYMSPEQAEGKPLDGRSDVYSLALVFYESLCGRQPFEATEPLAQLVQRLQHDPTPLAVHLPNVDPELAAVLMRALARDRERRFASAAELRRILLPMLGDEKKLPPLVPLAPTPAAERLASGTTEVPGPHVEPPELGTSPVTFHVEPSTVPEPRPHARVRRWWWVGIAALALGAAGGYGFWPTRPVPSPSAPMSLDRRPLETVSPPPPALPSQEVAIEPEPAATERDLRLRPAPNPEQVAVPPPPRRAVTFPRLIEQPAPELDAQLAARCGGQVVVLSLKVGEDGRVTGVKVLRSGDADCAAAAEATARRYVFSAAADAAGQPVAASTTISLQFAEGSP